MIIIVCGVYVYVCVSQPLKILDYKNFKKIKMNIPRDETETK